MIIGKKCSVIGCEGLHVAKGLCDMHYMRMKRKGTLEATPDRGKRDSHPMYKIWSNIIRHHKKDAPNDWMDFWVFVADIGNKPNNSVRFVKSDNEKPYAINNWMWLQLDATKDNEEKRKKAVKYQQQLRVSNPDYFRNADLKRNYGVTLEWYEKTLAEQNGACAVCGKPEDTVIHGKKIRLSVDHCHDTGKVRGLLCRACNNAIGAMMHEIPVLQKAIEYLKTHK